MMGRVSPPMHPDRALFDGERSVPDLAPCDHYAGNERFMRKALELQSERGPRFDVTLDLEDGAPAGRERDHAQLVVALLRGTENRWGAAGVRLHDGGSPHWPADLDAVVRGAGERVAHLTLPKAVSARQVAEMVSAVQRACAAAGLQRELPLHVLIETHGALRDAFRIAALPWVRTLEFGLMDFVSAHQGAIPASAMRSPGQFEHALVRRAKAEIAAAALAHGLVPVHNVSVDLAAPQAAGADARRARQDFGFLRMWSIHPGQIEPILAAFEPAADEVRLSAEIVLAAHAADWAPVRHADTLHDRASYRYHWQLLRRARRAGQRLPDEVVARFFAEQCAD
jgi:citrate lyase subunit beta/citryl-CoA lyase